MSSSSETDRIKNLHWICDNTPIDSKTKFDPAEFYSIIGSGETFHSCADEDSDRLSFEIKGPYTYHAYAASSEQQPRCLALDLFFKEPVKIAMIRLQNHYVAYLSVLAKIVGYRDWQTLVHRKQLMPAPQYETGSQAYFEVRPLTADPWTDITEIRLLLVQPSSCWKKFSVEHVTVIRENVTTSSSTRFNGGYLTNLIQKTEEALRMERRNEAQPSTPGSTIPFHIGTTGYEIEKLPPLC